MHTSAVQDVRASRLSTPVGNGRCGRKYKYRLCGHPMGREVCMGGEIRQRVMIIMLFCNVLSGAPCLRTLCV
jgi:hypothetical protein